MEIITLHQKKTHTKNWLLSIVGKTEKQQQQEVMTSWDIQLLTLISNSFNPQHLTTCVIMAELDTLLQGMNHDGVSSENQFVMIISYSNENFLGGRWLVLKNLATKPIYHDLI